MTCADFAAITDRDPADVTRAERVGVFVHYRSCDACRRQMDADYQESMRELPELTGIPTAMIEAAMDLELMPMIDEDMTDPEVRATLAHKPEPEKP